VAGPLTPPVGTRFSTGQDLALLDGPTSAPPGAVVVAPGNDLIALTNANPAGTTFYLQTGRHALGGASVDQFTQITAKTGNTYIGAPGAVLDGQNVAQYAFIGAATGVTIKYLEVTNFPCPFDEFVVNHECSTGWILEYCNIHHNGGAGFGIGTDNIIRYSWMHHNAQYGFSCFKYPINDGLTNAVSNTTVHHIELQENGDLRDEFQPDGSPTFFGRNGGCKFWDCRGIYVGQSWIHHNWGTALWADTNNVVCLTEDNLFEDNSNIAFFYEISYNFRVLNNTFRRNALPGGLQNNRAGDPFPTGAIYISESGGDSRVSSTYATSTIEGNTFINNNDNVVLWEGSMRFCNSPANTSGKVYKPLGGTAHLNVCNNPADRVFQVTLTSGSPNVTITTQDPTYPLDYTDEGANISCLGVPAGTRVRFSTDSNGFLGGVLNSTQFVMTATATLTGSFSMTFVGGTIDEQPAYYDCRWHTQNILVSGNAFYSNVNEMLGARNIRHPTQSDIVGLGRHGIFSDWGVFPVWSPYNTDTIAKAVLLQNNVFQNNTYKGEFRFKTKFMNEEYNFAGWRAAPNNQDVGSTLDPVPRTGDGGGTVYLPDPPTAVTATAGNGQALVSFTPPVDDGGDILIGYTVTATPGGATATAVGGPITIGGLTNGTPYTFTVTARTPGGVSVASTASTAVTPTVGASLPTSRKPWAPFKVGVHRSAAKTSARVGFLRPPLAGSSAITSYTAVATDPDGGTITASAAISPITLTGLDPAVDYTYTVTATNSVGISPASQPVPRTAAAGASTPPGGGGTGGDVLNTWVTAAGGNVAAAGVFATLAGTQTQIVGRNI
jgi:hypothetical protein